MRLSKGMATNKELGVMTSFDNDSKWPFILYFVSTSMHVFC